MGRTIQIEEDLVDQLFSPSEKMVGMTRSRVNFFMKKFQRLGFIDYTDGLTINNSLLTVVFHD